MKANFIKRKMKSFQRKGKIYANACFNRFNKYINELGWSKLRALGHNSIIKSSYIWLIIVPLVAKMLQALPEQHIFIIFGANITVHFGLPFSWIVFYFMAIFFAIGQLIYSLKCPEILKNYTNFSDYEKRGGGHLLILKWLEKILINYNMINFKKINYDIQNFLGNILPKPLHDVLLRYVYGKKENINPKLDQVLNEITKMIKEEMKIKQEEDSDIFLGDRLFILCRKAFFYTKESNLNDWFYAISYSYEQVDQNYLKASVICFGLGFFFFTIIAIQNLWFVIKAIF